MRQSSACDRGESADGLTALRHVWELSGKQAPGTAIFHLLVTGGRGGHRGDRLHAQKAEFRIHSLTADCSGVLGESAHKAPTQSKQGLVAYARGPTMGQPEAGDKQKF